MKRPMRPETPDADIVDLAVRVSGKSPCRSQRGVVIFNTESLVSIGFNYKPDGFACDGSAVCKETCRTEAIHAEQSALLYAGPKAIGADMLHVKSVNGQLVPSRGPSCVECSKLAIAAGIAGVWLYHESGWKRYDAQTFHQLSLSAVSRPLGGETPALEGGLAVEILHALDPHRTASNKKVLIVLDVLKRWRASSSPETCVKSEKPRQ